MTATAYRTKQQRWSVRQHTKEQARKQRQTTLNPRNGIGLAFICVLAHRQILSRGLCWVSLAIYCESIPGSLEFKFIIFDCALLLMANTSGRRDTGRGSAGFSEIKTYTSQLSRFARRCRELVMNTSQWQSKIKSAVLALALLFGAAIIWSPTAHAQYRYPSSDQNQRDQNLDRYPNYGGSAELRETALNAGYNQGSRQASYDRQNGGQPNYRNSDVYRRATQDYNSRLGDREIYRRYFREAFEKGYNSYANNQGNAGRDNRNQYPDRDNNGNRTRRGRNWDGYGNLGGSAELRQTALNAGYNEGNKQGKKDHGKRNNSNYQGQTAYQNATKDYNSRLGDRGVYQRYFREAYDNGYSDGLNGY